MTTEQPANTPTVPASTTSPPPLLPLRVYPRLVCGVWRYYLADERAQRLIKSLLKYPTLTEEKRADLERLGVQFLNVNDPRATDVGE